MPVGDGTGQEHRTVVACDVSEQLKTKVDALCGYRTQLALAPEMFPESSRREIFAWEYFEGAETGRPAEPAQRSSGLDLDSSGPQRHTTIDPLVATARRSAAQVLSTRRTGHDTVNANQRQLIASPTPRRLTGRWLCSCGTTPLSRHLALDDLRVRDYGRLDAGGHTISITGGGLYGESQLARHHELLANSIFGNPHSQNQPSQDMSDRVEATRRHILEFFRASSDEYEVIFTPNATGALRLVGESYPFGSGSQYLLIFDNHNSVNGIREFARARGATVTYVPLAPDDLRVSSETLARRSRGTGRRSASSAGPEGAAALPTTCSPFQRSRTSRESSTRRPGSPQAQAAGWDVVLDAAAFAPTNRLDLSSGIPTS